MTTPITTMQSTNRAGLCPHGLVPSACPICSNMSGGGGKINDSVKSSKTASQWSWIKCYNAGIAMKANATRAENNKTAFERQIEFAKQLHKTISDIKEKLHKIFDNIQSTLPQFFKSTVNFVFNFIINPVLNLMLIVPKIIDKFAQLQQNIQNFLMQAAEKLTALIGEIKNFINKKISQGFKKRIKKFFFFLSEENEENYEKDSELNIFGSKNIEKYSVNIPRKKGKEEK